MREANWNRCRPIGNLAVCLLLMLAGLPKFAEAKIRSSVEEESRIAQCIEVAASGKPWLAKTLWGLRDQEGGWVGAAVLNTNGTHDLGPLQINSWWVPRIASLVGRSPGDVREWLRSDPCFNVDAARWIFLSALASAKDYWAAVGIYHSPTKVRQRRYAASVADKLTRRFGPRLWASRGLTIQGKARAATRIGNPQSPSISAAAAIDIQSSR